MSTLELNGKDFATQTSSAEPVLASTVTGSPALTLTNATFPAGHILQTVNGKNNSESAQAQAWDTTSLTVTIPELINANAKVLMSYDLHVGWYHSGGGMTHLGLFKCYESVEGASPPSAIDDSQIMDRHWGADSTWNQKHIGLTGYLRTVSNSAGDSYTVTVYAMEIAGGMTTNVDLGTQDGINTQSNESHITLMEIAL